MDNEIIEVITIPTPKGLGNPVLKKTGFIGEVLEMTVDELQEIREKFAKGRLHDE